MKRFAVRIALFVLGLLTALDALAQAPPARIIQWVESADASDNSRIALGYPVPLPVDTPLPFAGFRSYAGLQARHQDLAVTTPWVHPEALGETREGRTIWLYRLGDSDRQTATGLQEHAMLTSGGIHAREWQSPEVATGIIELLALGPDDRHLLSYLRDNANILVIPVLNIDGFLQTQRYPGSNWLGTDPDDPEASPRDGRMRRKNMLDADDDLETTGDHLFGVDLNRNYSPFWNTNSSRSSDDPASLVHHGQSAFSEPETRVLDQAAELGPASKLSMFTDMHSFSQVHFWVRNSNTRLALLTEGLLRTFSGFHRNFPARKNYHYSTTTNVPRNQGIGTADEYFTHTYQVPSWTLEIEPSNGAPYHAPLPGGGADYGGLGRNGHDGFILPESEIERVRTELAETFAIAYYRQTGPPAIQAVHLVDTATGAVVFQAEWIAATEHSRELHIFQAQPLQLGREYRGWISWDKPMRWRIDDTVTTLPGQSATTLEVQRRITIGDGELNASIGAANWLDRLGASPDGYRRYRDDAMEFSFVLTDDENNRGLVHNTTLATLRTGASDFSGWRNDADPATVARWENGAWSGYEDGEGSDTSDSGGTDSTLGFAVSGDPLGDPFVVEPAVSSAWFDPQRDGEGFLLEILPGARATMYWFTYDGQGDQDWYVAQGQITGNRILFPEILRVSGGEFGPGFDPEQVERTVVGEASFIWSSCDAGAMDWKIESAGNGLQSGRMNLVRLSRLAGLDCGGTPNPADADIGRLSGSWYDPSHSGEGFVLEVLADRKALVYWFSYDADGRRRWFFGVDESVDDGLRFDQMLTTSGAVFGPGFEPEDVEFSPWGSLRLELDCREGTASFEPIEPGFPPGSLDLARLTRLDGLECDP